MKQNQPRRKTVLLLIAIVLFITCVRSKAQEAATDSSKTITEAIKLIDMPEPTFKPFQPQKMDSTQIADMGFEQVYSSEPIKFRMRDGKTLHAQSSPKNQIRP